MACAIREGRRLIAAEVQNSDEAGQYGLASMLEWAEEAGAEFEVASAVGEGTVIFKWRVGLQR